MKLTVLVLGDPTWPFLKMLDRLPSDADVRIRNSPEEAAAEAPNADVVLSCAFDHKLFHAVLPHATKARWIHSLSAGVEGLMSPALAAHPAPLTNARGAFRRSLAEFAIGGALYFAKEMPRLLRQQREKLWDTNFTPVELHDATMGVVGYGEIGRACAERAHAFGTKILALRRRPEQSASDPIVSASFRPDQLLEMLPQCDYVVIAAPNTADTKQMIGERELAAMKPTAVLINVGRGTIVDEGALIRALQEKRLKGAVLDVFAKEPLPPESPLWDLDNVLISPHCADRTPGWIEGALEVFMENFERFVKGEPLKNVVDKHAGY
ncbi:MAG: D-2-hydroxyacid dehydrogenase [Bryobacteraceae bacterium]